MRNDEPDVFHVDPRHDAVHAALLNWAAWAQARPARMYTRSPLWKLARVGFRQASAPVRNVTDDLAAARIEKIVAGLPALHRDALRWWYVWQFPVNEFIRRYGLTRVKLLQVCSAARDMVANLN